MRIRMRTAEAKRLAAAYYSGDSLPISSIKPEDQPLDPEWWTSNVQPESSGSARHSAALRLYLEVAKASAIPLPQETFPAVFDLEDGRMRPDKAVIKVFLDEGLLATRMMVAQLVFDLTEAGRRYVGQAGSR